MHVQLIYPIHRPFRHKRIRQLVPPLGLAMIAAVTPKDVSVGLTDQYLDHIRYTRRYDLVGLTGLTPNIQMAYDIADRFRRIGVRVVMGGMHVSSLPEEALQHADAVVVGEAEAIWPKVIADFKAGKMEGVYRSDAPLDLAGLPFARRDLFDIHRYIVKAPVETSRGCPFNCMYCSDALVFGKKYRFRPIEEVVEEIRRIGRRYVFFVDNNIVGNPGRAKRLFEALIPLRIRWTAQASITMAYDEELLRLAARSGCFGVLVGLETLKKGLLADIGKPVDPAKYKEHIARIQKHGIFVQGEFIFGFDEDDESVFEETVSFAEDAQLGSARFAILKPYPGTRLYSQWKREGRILHDDWRRYVSNNVVYRPKRLTPEQLVRGRDMAYDRLATLRSIWRRVGLRQRRALPIWLVNVANMLFKNSRST